MLISEQMDYMKDGDENSGRPILDINSPIYYGGIPQGVNASFLEVSRQLAHAWQQQF